MTNTNELTAKLKAAAEDEIMCREACDTSDLWQDVASPENVLALVEALEKREELRAAANKVVVQQDIEIYDLRQRIGELEASHAKLRESMAAIHNAICLDGAGASLSGLFFASKRAYEESAAAAGIKLQIEGE